MDSCCRLGAVLFDKDTALFLVLYFNKIVTIFLVGIYS